MGWLAEEAAPSWVPVVAFLGRSLEPDRERG
jgi:hypothetical protein